uniref:F-box domain-containing protein n=1 Tax=Oryza punctata TaxID=4537 RepID=A0A0E0MEG7_ORYPU
MPEKFTNEGNNKVVMADGADHISALPDELLQYLLSFLPSREAVQTCVLSQRWRHQWKYVPALQINDVDNFYSVQQLNKFVHHLLLHRKRIPLYVCELDSFHNGEVAQWYQYAVSCEVEVLRVDTAHSADYCRLPDMAITSNHLTTLEFSGVQLGDISLDFSSCPKLEVLVMRGCKILVQKILSQSVTSLSITQCNFQLNTRTRISAPSLISLELADILGWTPALESLPSLSTAFVRLDDRCEDYCLHSYYGDCGDQVSCGKYCNRFYDVHDNDCVLLGGLSNVTNLELITSPKVFIVRKDLLMHPTFSKLKTLLLNVSDADAGFGPLVYILRNSPILEKLTLQLYEEPKGNIETDGSCNLEERFVASKKLKVVEIKCSKSAVLRRVLRILNTYGVPRKKINIEHTELWSFGSHFSFEQTS